MKNSWKITVGVPLIGSLLTISACTTTSDTTLQNPLTARYDAKVENIASECPPLKESLATEYQTLSREMYAACLIDPITCSQAPIITARKQSIEEIEDQLIALTKKIKELRVFGPLVKGSSIENAVYQCSLFNPP